MNTGITINNNVTVYINEIKEILLHDLDMNNIKYEVIFDKVSKQKIKETIIHILGTGIELSIENDIIKYIKSDCNEYTKLYQVVEGHSKVNTIREIKEKIHNKFNNNPNINIENINTDSFTMSVIIVEENHRIRIHVNRDHSGNIYINTIRFIE